MVRLEAVSKVYPSPKGEIRALDNIDLQCGVGEFVVVRGPSGSGKTTLLMVIGSMLRPSSGRVTVGGKVLSEMDSGAKARFRAQNVGFVFQMFHLIAYLNVLENVVMGSIARDRQLARERSRELLAGLGMTQRLECRPAELSAGEKQRTAIARALINEPKIILADEPTGNLDPANAHAVLEYLADFHRKGGTVVLATHSSEAEEFADRTLLVEAGRVIF